VAGLSPTCFWRTSRISRFVFRPDTASRRIHRAPSFSAIARPVPFLGDHARSIPIAYTATNSFRDGEAQLTVFAGDSSVPFQGRFRRSQGQSRECQNLRFCSSCVKGLRRTQALSPLRTIGRPSLAHVLSPSSSPP